MLITFERISGEIVDESVKERRKDVIFPKLSNIPQRVS